MLAKLKKADDEYKRMIEFARKESDLIISKAEKKKNELIHEAHLVAEEDKKKIIEEGKYKVKIMKADAERENEKLEKQLKEERIDSVKQTSKKVVKRLLKHNNLQATASRRWLEDFNLNERKNRVIKRIRRESCSLRKAGNEEFLRPVFKL
jgi:vacuolar-type H+-ATPase subunit H